MKKQHIKEIIYRAKWVKQKIMEKLNRAQKYLILEPQNLGLRGTGALGPLDLHLDYYRILTEIL